MADWLAGAARLEITPVSPCMLYGYAARNRPHEGVHDPLFVRAVCLRDAAGTEAAIVCADVLWFASAPAQAVRDLLAAELALPSDLVFLAATHTHSAPATGGADVPFNAAWTRLLVAQSVAAVALAKSRFRPARLRAARGTCVIGVNRRERRPDGGIVLGRNPDGPCDREIVGLALDAEDGTPVARLANFACHGVVMGQESYQISADWPGAAARRIEAAWGGAPFLLVQGGAGNVNPRIGPQNDFRPVEELGTEFARDWEKVEDRWRILAPTSPLSGAAAPVVLPLKQGGTRRVVLAELRIGSVRLVGVPAELFSETTIAVKDALPDEWVLPCSYAGGGDDGYVPVAEAYADGGYEVDVSPYTPDAERLVRAALTAGYR